MAEKPSYLPKIGGSRTLTIDTEQGALEVTFKAFRYAQVPNDPTRHQAVLDVEMTNVSFKDSAIGCGLLQLKSVTDDDELAYHWEWPGSNAMLK